MKILLDTCVWGGALKTLELIGHDVVWSGNWDIDPGDEKILAIAHREGRILITLDKDFGELAIVFGKPHSGRVRLVSIAARQPAIYCDKIITKYASELQAGAIITVSHERIRIRESI